MKITVNDLINLELCGTIKYFGATKYLKNEIKAVSFIEVPDYHNYLVPNSVLITTLPNTKDFLKIHNDFLVDIKNSKISCLIIKDKKTIKNFETLFETTTNIPIIILKDDVNLSILMDQISSILHRQKITEMTTDKVFSYSELFWQVNSIANLMEIVTNTIGYHFHLQINQNTTYSSSKEFSEKINNKNSIYKINDIIRIKKEIYCNQKYYCTFYVGIDKAQIISAFEVIEYISFILLVLKNKQENELLQNQENLKSFLKTITNSHEDPSIKNYLNVHFPLQFLFISKNEENNFNKIKKYFLSNFQIENFYFKEVKIKDFIIFIFSYESLIKTNFQFMKFSEEIFKDSTLNVKNTFLSKNIDNSKEIEKIYLDSNYLISHLNSSNTNQKAFFLNEFDAFNLIKNTSNEEMIQFMHSKIGKLFQNRKPNVTLIETLNILIQSNFNLKISANRLFVHYNTLRYRITSLESLGFELQNKYFNPTDISLAITIFYIVYLPNEEKYKFM